MTGQKICHYEKYGYCKMKEECLFFHPKETCRKVDCDVKNCRQRHPQICRFFILGNCKFNESCRFDHATIETVNDQKIKLKELENKVQMLEKLSQNQEKVIEVLKDKIKTIDSEVLPFLNTIIDQNKTKKRKRLKSRKITDVADEFTDENITENSQSKKNRFESTHIADISETMSVDDDSIFEDMNYKEILFSEIQILSELDKMFNDVKNNLKLKKICETKTSLKNIEIIVEKDQVKMKEVEHNHRHIDAEDNNVFKILNNIKSSIEMLENVAMNKFRKVTETELDKILEEIKIARMTKEMMCYGVFDVPK